MLMQVILFGPVVLEENQEGAAVTTRLGKNNIVDRQGHLYV